MVVHREFQRLVKKNAKKYRKVLDALDKPIEDESRTAGAMTTIGT